MDERQVEMLFKMASDVGISPCHFLLREMRAPPACLPGLNPISFHDQRLSVILTALCDVPATPANGAPSDTATMDREALQVQFWDVMRRSAMKTSSKPAGAPLPYLDTPQGVVDEAIALAALTKDDLFLDLGCGDGRLIIAAATAGARAIGVDYDSELVEKARQEILSRGLADRCDVYEADFLQPSFYETTKPWAKATVIYLFGNSAVIDALEPWLLTLHGRILTYHWPLQTLQPVAIGRAGALRLFSRAER